MSSFDLSILLFLLIGKQASIDSFISKPVITGCLSFNGFLIHCALQSIASFLFLLIYVSWYEATIVSVIEFAFQFVVRGGFALIRKYSKRESQMDELDWAILFSAGTLAHTYFVFYQLNVLLKLVS